MRLRLYGAVVALNLHVGVTHIVTLSKPKPFPNTGACDPLSDPSHNPMDVSNTVFDSESHYDSCAPITVVELDTERLVTIKVCVIVIVIVIASTI